MRNKRPSTFISVFTILAVVTPPSIVDALKGGKYVSLSDYPYMRELRMYTSRYSFGECSATNIGPNAIMTAAHCVKPFIKARHSRLRKQKYGNGTIYSSRNIGKNIAGLYIPGIKGLKVRQIYTHNNYIGGSSYSNHYTKQINNSNDLAVLILDGNHNRDYIPVHTKPLASQQKQRVTMMGFGAQNYNKEPRRFRNGKKALQIGFNQVCSTKKGSYLTCNRRVASTQKAGINDGDSGGALKAKVDGKTVLVGVVHGKAEVQDGRGTRHFSIFSHFTNKSNKSFLKNANQLAKNSKKGGIDFSNNEKSIKPLYLQTQYSEQNEPKKIKAIVKNKKPIDAESQKGAQSITYRGVVLPSCKYMSQSECQVFHLTNEKRVDHGLKPLLPSNSCHQVAQDRAIQFAKANREATKTHKTFTGEDPSHTAARLFGKNYMKHYWKFSENLAPNYSPSRAVREWMLSKSHRENILDPELTHLGVGWGSNKNFRGHLDQLPHSESNFYKGFWIQCFHNGKDFKSKNVVQKREATERVPASMAPQKNEDFTYEERPPQRFRKYSRPKKNYGPCGITGHDYSNSNCLMWHISGIPAAN